MIILTVVVYFLANQTQVGWVYLASAVLGALLLVSWLAARATSPFLRVDRVLRPDEGSEFVAGRVATLVVTVATRRPRLLLDLRQQFPWPGGSAAAWLLLSLPAGRPMTLRQSCTLPRRGRFLLPPMSVGSAAPFGIFQQSRLVGHAEQLTVYPDYLPLYRLPRGSARPAAVTAHRRAGHGIDFYGTREFRPGDPLRAIDWRATARHQQLVVAEREEPSHGMLGIVLDLCRDRQAGEEPETTLEYAVKIAASLAHAAHAEQQLLSLFCAADPPITRRAGGWRAVRELLTDVEATGTLPCADLMAATTPLPRMAVLLPWPQEDALAVVHGWLAAGVQVIVVLLIAASFSGTDAAASALAEAEAQVVAAGLRRRGAVAYVVRRGQSLADLFDDGASGGAPRVTPVNVPLGIPPTKAGS